MSGFMITATDTDIGKTIVAGGIAGVLRKRGWDTGVFKPIQSGHLATDPAGDAARLQHLSGVQDLLSDICPYSLEEPLAPLLALRRAGQQVYLGDLMQHYEKLRFSHSSMIVEGAGGLAVPYTEDGLVVDLAVRLGLPLLIVAGPGLGTVNHTVLTIEYARQRGLHVAGVILCGFGKTPPGIPEKTNPAMIREYGDVAVLGSIPWLGSSPTREQILQAVESTVDVERLESYLNK